MVYLEADDLAAAFTILGASAEPFDRWFRGHLRQVHGIAWAEGFTAPDLVLDYGTSRVWSPDQEGIRDVGSAHHDAREARQRHRQDG